MAGALCPATDKEPPQPPPGGGVVGPGPPLQAGMEKEATALCLVLFQVLT